MAVLLDTGPWVALMSRNIKSMGGVSWLTLASRSQTLPWQKTGWSLTWLMDDLSRCRWLGSQGFCMQHPRSVTTGRLQVLATESTGQMLMRT